MRSHDQGLVRASEVDASAPSVVEEAGAGSRRRFLGRTAAAGLVLAGSAVAEAGSRGKRPRSSGPAAGSGGGGIAAEKKKTTGLPELYPNWNAINFSQIRNDENQHVAFLVNALGSHARPRPTFQNLEQPDVKTFALTSLVLENTGVGAYLGAAPVIAGSGYLAAAGSILTIEARHSGYLGTLLDTSSDLFLRSFDQPLTINQVVSNASPFLVSLNGGPPLTFSGTPSAENDLEILNFALALEFLEQEFYNINVPKFFGV